jgi:hypothetical protein
MSENENLDVRKLLLNFYSSELNAHARLIIGASVLLFTVVSITLDLKNNSDFGALQSAIAIVSFGFISSALWYLLMRNLAYGILASTSQHAVIRNMSYEEARDEVRDAALPHRIFLLIPSRAYISVGRARSENTSWYWRHGMFLGSILCLGLGLATTYLLCLFIGLWHYDTLQLLSQIAH